jgi:hypothetical protein
VPTILAHRAFAESYRRSQATNPIPLFVAVAGHESAAARRRIAGQAILIPGAMHLGQLPRWFARSRVIGGPVWFSAEVDESPPSKELGLP